MVSWEGDGAPFQESDTSITHQILEHVEAIEILLQGLCGVNKERLRIHELCLKSSPNLERIADIKRKMQQWW